MWNPHGVWRALAVEGRASLTKGRDVRWGLLPQPASLPPAEPVLVPRWVWGRSQGSSREGGQEPGPQGSAEGRGVQNGHMCDEDGQASQGGPSGRCSWLLAQVASCKSRPRRTPGHIPGCPGAGSPGWPGLCILACPSLTRGQGEEEGAQPVLGWGQRLGGGRGQPGCAGSLGSRAHVGPRRSRAPW